MRYSRVCPPTTSVRTSLLFSLYLNALLCVVVVKRLPALLHCVDYYLNALQFVEAVKRLLLLYHKEDYYP